MYRKALALLINPHSVNLRQPKFILNGVKHCMILLDSLSSIYLDAPTESNFIFEQR